LDLIIERPNCCYVAGAGTFNARTGEADMVSSPPGRCFPLLPGKLPTSDLESLRSVLLEKGF
jgi:hypothetical protein